MAKEPSPSPEIRSTTPSAAQLSYMEGGKLSPMLEGKITSFEEKVEIYPTNIQKVGAEFVGTFILIFIGCGAIFVNQRINITLIGVALAWGTAVSTLIYTLGHISGAHINPAVTIAFATAGIFPWKQVPLYVVAQVVGGILASVALRGMFDGDSINVIISIPPPKTNDLTAIAAEIIVSFILMWVICGAASDPRAIKALSGASVGAAVFFNSIVAGTISGASMNPARSIGPAIATMKYHKLWIYVLGPTIGTVAGSSLYNLFRSPERRDE